jgi:hypothetical protein
MSVVFGKMLRWGDKEDNEFQNLARQLIGGTLLDVYVNDTGGLTLAFATDDDGKRVKTLVIAGNLALYLGDKL